MKYVLVFLLVLANANAFAQGDDQPCEAAYYRASLGVVAAALTAFIGVSIAQPVNEYFTADGQAVVKPEDNKPVDTGPVPTNTYGMWDWADLK